MERIELTEGAIKDFRDDHRKLRDMLIELKGSLESKNVDKSKKILTKINDISGPHIRFEEEFLYPVLRGFLGDYIDRFYLENDMLIHTVRSFFSLLEKGKLTDQEVWQSVDAVRMLLVHICNSEGLSLMFEKLTQRDMDEIEEKCRYCKREGVPMLRWADTMRAVRKIA